MTRMKNTTSLHQGGQDDSTGAAPLTSSQGQPFCLQHSWWKAATKTVVKRLVRADGAFEVKTAHSFNDGTMEIIIEESQMSTNAVSALSVENTPMVFAILQV